MIGIVLVGHAHIGREMIRAVEHVLGPQSLLLSVDAGPEQDLRAMRRALEQAMRACDVGHGVLLLTDMFGGTPCNLAIEQAARREGVAIVSGYSLPLLIKAVSLRAQLRDLRELAQRAVDSGRQYMCLASDLLGDARPCRPADGDAADA